MGGWVRLNPNPHPLGGVHALLGGANPEPNSNPNPNQDSRQRT